MLYTASFYAPEHWVGQVYRVSRRHPRGRKVGWETLPFLYPALELLRAYREGALDFPGFTQEYRNGLDAALALQDQFRGWLEEISSLGDFTLLCFEPEGQNCHRLVAARWLLERVSSLEPGALR